MGGCWLPSGEVLKFLPNSSLSPRHPQLVDSKKKKSFIRTPCARFCLYSFCSRLSAKCAADGRSLARKQLKSSRLPPPSPLRLPLLPGQLTVRDSRLAPWLPHSVSAHDTEPILLPPISKEMASQAVIKLIAARARGPGARGRAGPRDFFSYNGSLSTSPARDPNACPKRRDPSGPEPSGESEELCR